MMNGAVEGYLEASEKEDETPLGHRLAKAALTTAVAIVGSWAAAKAYENFVYDADEEETDDDIPEPQE